LIRFKIHSIFDDKYASHKITNPENKTETFISNKLNSTNRFWLTSFNLILNHWISGTVSWQIFSWKFFFEKLML